jgi:predicted nucleotidyltransferase
LPPALVIHKVDDIIHLVSEAAPSLLPIFRSQHQLGILGYLYVYAGKAFSLANISRATTVPQATVSREVDRLSKAGLVVTSTAGRMKMAEANTDSPYFSDLQSILLKASGPATLLREHLSKVPGIEEAYIFGSWARRYEGELGPPPVDIDVAVVGDADPDDVDASCRAVERSLGMEVNPVLLTPREWRSRRSPFVRQLKNAPLVPLLDHAQ